MPDTPAKSRRWFQFRLSTWFVLVGIVAWAMWLGPLSKRQESARRNNPANPGQPEYYQVTYTAINPSRALYPALALVALVGGKTAWRIVERRRAKAAADSLT